MAAPLSPSSGPFWRNRRVRDAFWQALALAVLGLAGWYFVGNASRNMREAGIASGFDFLWRMSGIDVPFVLTGYTPQASIAALLWAGVVNTLVVSLVAVIAATLLGFLLGIARLSANRLLRGLAGAFVEFVRNIPLLFFVMFWYFGIIAALPGLRQSFSILDLFFLNNRGLIVPVPLATGRFTAAALFMLGCLGAQAGLAAWARRRRERTGRSFPAGLSGVVLLVVAPALAFAWAGLTTAWEVPVPRGFGFRGGFVVVPEFLALFAALATYTAAFIAEIVRGAILAVDKGQWEAAAALGLPRGRILALIVIPQALRIMVPPMTSQYLNVLKNSSFGAAIAYPEIVSVFMGSALNNTGQAVEIIAITLAIYLTISLAVSGVMNWYNARTALVTR